MVVGSVRLKGGTLHPQAKDLGSIYGLCLFLPNWKYLTSNERIFRSVYVCGCI